MPNDLIVEPPSISPENHGPRIILVGGVMLAAVAIMLFVTFSNRYISKTMLKLDSIGMLIGAALSVAHFSMWAVAVAHGFGRHRDKLTDSEASFIRKIVNSSMLIFFISHGLIKLSYNSLARRTARSQKFKTYMDAFSVLIGLWTLANIIVVAIAIGEETPPKRSFLYTSGIISILIVIGQLAAYLFIIWNTTNTLRKKIEWSLSMGSFVPFCIASITTRLALTPPMGTYFKNDWTYHNVWPSVTLLVELNMVILTVLAPNLPNFFDKTSTGGVYYLPGEVTTRPRTRGMRMEGDLEGESGGGVAMGSGGLGHSSFVAGAGREGNSISTLDREGVDGIRVRTSVDVRRSEARDGKGTPQVKKEDGLVSFREMFE